MKPKKGQIFSAAAMMLSASLAAGPASGNPNPSTLSKETIQKYVADSQKVVDAWLALVDRGNYGESWDQSSNILHATMSRSEWEKAMTTLRKPLGNVVSRKILDIGTAENPKGMPEGDYMVYYYETAFTNKPKGTELITLVLSTDGKWKVVTYQDLSPK